MESFSSETQPCKPLPLLLTPSLQGLRFFAALLVFFGHMGWNFAGANGSLYFLVLSGYAVTRLLVREWSLTGKIAISAFWRNRAKKLFPPFALAMAVTLVIKLLIGAPILWNHALSMLIFVGNYYNAFFKHPAAGFSLYWTLSLLVQYYILWPICFAYLMEKSRIHLIAITSLWILIPLCIRATLIHRGSSIFPYIYNSFESRVDALAIGSLLGLTATRPLFEKLKPWIARTGCEPILILSLLFYLGAQDDLIRLSWGLSAQSLLICVLIVQMVLLKNHSAWKWLSHPTTVYLGSLSYLFYLFHGIGKSIGLKIPAGVAAQSIGGLTATLLLAALLQPWFSPKSFAFPSASTLD